MFFGCRVKLLLAQYCERLHLFHNLTHMLHCVNHVAGTSFTLGTNHGCAFGDPTESLAEIPRAANKGCIESVLINMVSFVCRGKDLAFVDEVDPELLQDLRFGKMPNASLGHDWNRNCLNNLLDQA